MTDNERESHTMSHPFNDESVTTFVTPGYDPAIVNTDPVVDISSAEPTPTNRHGRIEDAAAAAKPQPKRRNAFPYGWIRDTFARAITENVSHGGTVTPNLLWSWLTDDERKQYRKAYADKAAIDTKLAHQLATVASAGYDDLPLTRTTARVYRYDGHPVWEFASTAIDADHGLTQVGYDMDKNPLYIMDGNLGTVQTVFTPIEKP